MKTGTALSELDRAIWHLMWSDDYQVVDRGDDWAELIYVHNDPPHPVTRIEIRKYKSQEVI